MLLKISVVSCAKVIPRGFFRIVHYIMSGMLLGNHFSHDVQKIIAVSVMATVSNPAINGSWLLVGRFREYLHEK